MTVFDYVVLGVIGLSVLLSIMRGFVREMLALAAWVAAFFVAKLYTLQLAPLLPQSIPSLELRLLAAFLALFLLTLLLCSLGAIALSGLFRQVGLGWLDRGLGALFGLARGMLVVLVAVLLAGLTALPREQSWREAMFSAPLEALVLYGLPWLPQGVAKHVKYD
jgi:membrane protein required for colicin V production